MKITFSGADPSNIQQTQERILPSFNGTKTADISKYQGGIMTDISGTSNGCEIFRGKGKTKDDIAADISSKDTGTMRDYLTVMSNMVSPEEMGKLMEDGVNPCETDVETTVTIIDHIKASLLKAGVEIDGFTDSIDDKALDSITGNTALSNQLKESFKEEGIPLTEDMARSSMEAYEKAKDIPEVSEDTSKYMLENDLSTTIEDLYTATHSSTRDTQRVGRGYYQEASGYLSRKADDIDYEALKPQIDAVIQKAGLSDIKGIDDTARWLVEKGIDLTPENLEAYMKISDLSLPATPIQIFGGIAGSVRDGKSPMEADLYDGRSSWKKASWLYERTMELTSLDVEKSVTRLKATGMSEESLTLRDIMISHDEGENEKPVKASSDLYDIDAVSPQVIKSRRQLEEIRLSMTLQANRELIKSGFSIDTIPIEDAIEALKTAERQINERLFGKPDPNQVSDDVRMQDPTGRAEIFQETVETVNALPSYPAALVGMMVSGKGTEIGSIEVEPIEAGLNGAEPAEGTKGYTLPALRSSGEKLANAYKHAGAQYETMGTQVRRDLGDTIKQAFRNVDDILADMSLPVDEANRRALRILGYNNMEISESNIAAVKEADQSVRYVMDRLSPGAVMEMIRDNVNPLSMTVEGLADYLSGKNDEETEREKYAKFLYRLEKNKEISKEERESYIGIMRLIRQIEKSDGAVIGSLVNQGAELTIKNLLSAVRSRKSRRLDVRIDDNTGVRSEISKPLDSIDSQIGRAFAIKDIEKYKYEKKLGAELYERALEMDGDEIAEFVRNDERGIEDFLWDYEFDPDKGQFVNREKSGDGEQLVNKEQFVNRDQFAFDEQFADKEHFVNKDDDYLKDQVAMIHHIEQGDDGGIEFLRMIEEPVSVENLSAFSSMKSSKGPDYKKLREISERSSDGNYDIVTEDDIEESFENAQKAQDTMKSYVKRAMEQVESAIYEGDVMSGAQVKELGLLYKQLSFVARLSESQHYEIPVFTEDDAFTLHLKVESAISENDKNSISAYMETKSLGKVAVKLKVADGKVSGLFIGSSAGTKEELDNLTSSLREALMGMGYQDAGISSGIRNGKRAEAYEMSEIYSETLNISQSAEGTGTGELYRVAKALVGVIRRKTS